MWYSCFKSFKNCVCVSNSFNGCCTCIHWFSRSRYFDFGLKIARLFFYRRHKWKRVQYSKGPPSCKIPFIDNTNIISSILQKSDNFRVSSNKDLTSTHKRQYTYTSLDLNTSRDKGLKMPMLFFRSFIQCD